MAEDSLTELKLPKSFQCSAGFVVSDATILKQSFHQNWKNRSLIFLQQVHGNHGLWVNQQTETSEGDWLATDQQDVIIGVFVADCTAILVHGENEKGAFVAAIHAGWRGTAKGIIEAAFESLKPKKDKLNIWLSPGICQDHYEVSDEVMKSFQDHEAKFFTPTRVGHSKLNLRALQRARLTSMGYQAVCSSLCTYEQPEFFSYRQMQSRLSARHFAWICLPKA